MSTDAAATEVPVALFARLIVLTSQHERFLELIGQLAVRSVTDEDGCRSYDVILLDEVTLTYGVYEQYDDSAALAAHHASPHYARWEAAAESLFVRNGVTVQSGPVVCSGRAGVGSASQTDV